MKLEGAQGPYTNSVTRIAGHRDGIQIVKQEDTVEVPSESLCFDFVLRSEDGVSKNCNDSRGLLAQMKF